MPDNGGPISPEQQRRFEKARRALEPLCVGRDRHLHHVRSYRRPDIPPETIERARWLLVAMGLARAAHLAAPQSQNSRGVATPLPSSRYSPLAPPRPCR